VRPAGPRVEPRRCTALDQSYGLSRTNMSLDSLKSRLVLPFWYRLTGADPENELGGGQFRGSPSGSRGGAPPPEADDFSQLKGYLDATSGILGGHGPLAPLKSATAGSPG